MDRLSLFKAAGGSVPLRHLPRGGPVGDPAVHHGDRREPRPAPEHGAAASGADAGGRAAGRVSTTATARSGVPSTAGRRCRRRPSLGLGAGGLPPAGPSAGRAGRAGSRSTPPTWPDVGPAAGRSAPVRPVGSAGGGAAGRSCLQAVMDELADLGFDPAVESCRRDDGRPRSPSPAARSGSWPRLYPDLVCQLHRGITEGILEGRWPPPRA